MKKQATLNIIMPILLELALVLSGFLIPKLIILHYGSEANGLVQSIAQFLSVISFFEAGVGKVVQYNLYGPLVNRDSRAISTVMAAAERFFRRLALGLLAYVLVLLLFYPSLVASPYSWQYTAVLIAAMAVSSFSQYYFGQASQLLLTADQRGYVNCLAHLVTVLLNTAVSLLLMQRDCSLQLVKLSTALIYLLRFFLIRGYVSRHYAIDRHVNLSGEPLRQKWNGLAQHVAYVVLDSTDILVLSLFSTLGNVSVYSAYNMVVGNIKKVFISATGGAEATIGKLLAGEDSAGLKRTFRRTEWLLHSAATLVYACTFVLIVPFIRVYTWGITDANYCRPLFALLITFANYFHTLRLPFSMVILSGGFYRETRRCYIAAAAVNLALSLLLVTRFGLVGVAIGTIVSMAYQNVWMAVFVYRRVLKESFWRYLKQLAADLGVVLPVYLLFRSFELSNLTYFAWALFALQVFAVTLLLLAAVNALLYTAQTRSLFQTLGRKLRPGKRENA